MLILLSCAKIMRGASKIGVPFSSEPLFKKEAQQIAKELADYSAEELQYMLKVNQSIALENRERYKYFSNADLAIEAVLGYSGIVFKRLLSEEFSSADFEYAQKHLRITSFCYGLLRPLDRINLYRLEGDVVLPCYGVKLFEFWREKLTDILINDVKAAGGILCNLASKEMRNLFDWNRVEQEVKVISPEFKTWKNGKLTTIVVYTKIARGETARYIIKNRIERIEDLHLDELASL